MEDEATETIDMAAVGALSTSTDAADCLQLASVLLETWADVSLLAADTAMLS